MDVGQSGQCGIGCLSWLVFECCDWAVTVCRSWNWLAASWHDELAGGRLAFILGPPG